MMGGKQAKDMTYMKKKSFASYQQINTLINY
jgi:hypothetical protein